MSRTRARKFLWAAAAGAIALGCASDDTGARPAAATPGAEVLAAHRAADRPARVASMLACTEIEIATRRTVDGAVPMSALLPRALWLATAEPDEAWRSAAAQRWAMRVISVAWRERFEELMAAYDPAMTPAEARALVRRVWTTDTLVPLADVAGDLATLCDRLGALASVAVGPGPSGYACPRTPTPDCAADAPSPPWGCPPPPAAECPDCPGLEDAEKDLAKLEELFEAAKADERLSGIVDALLEALLDAIESGDPPSPADLALAVVSAVLGPEYPELTFYVDLIVSTMEGFTAGGPVGGMAALAWALFTGWGDFADASQRLADLDAARDRLNARRRWCEELDWPSLQKACEAYEAAELERRTSECAEADATYQALLSQWEADGAACDAERAAAAAANDAASSMTGRLQGSKWAFTPAAFELCCDEPVGAPKCPPDGSGLDPVPFPPWAKGPGAGGSLAGSLVSGDARMRAYGPDARGAARVRPTLGASSAVGWRDFTSTPLVLTRVTVAGSAAATAATTVVILDQGALAGDGTWGIELGSAPARGADLPTETLGLEIEAAYGDEVLGGTLPAAIELVDNRAELVPVVVAGGAVHRLVAGPAPGGATPWADGVASPTALWADPGSPLVLLGTGDGEIFDVAGGGSFSGAAPWATLRAGAHVSDLHRQEALGRWIVTDLLHGELLAVSAGGDHTATTPFATGLSFPVATTTLADGTIVCAENGKQRLVDVTAGGDLSAAPAYATLGGYLPQHFLWLGAPGAERLLVGAADSTGAGALFDVASPGVAFALGPFNPAGTALNPWTGQALVTSFAPAPDGAVHDVTAITSGADLTVATPYATGLQRPGAVGFVYVPGAL
ncbi:MAG: hypothetical protein IT376_07345 [Polyangiaceae bacterium]|nr:hypothetical protein [Polyangiaceae bacterium]